MAIKIVPQPHYCLDLVSCDFWLFPKHKEKLRGCRYETIEEMKEAVTKVIDTFTQEDFHGAFHKFVVTVQQVHGSRRRLIRRGLEFNACTFNKNAPPQSLETYLMILAYSKTLFYLF